MGRVCSRLELDLTHGLSMGRVCSQPELDLKTLGREKGNPKLTKKTCQISQYGTRWVLGCIGWFQVLLMRSIFG